jgi:hypothetical protein
MALKLATLFAVISWLSLSVGAVAAPPDNPCDLPRDLQPEIATKFPGARAVEVADLSDYDKKLFQKDHGRSCPGLVKVDFYGDHRPTVALALKSGKSDTKLVIARKTDAGWTTVLVDSANESTAVVWTEKPGKYDGLDEQRDKTLVAAWPVIVFCGYGSWAIVYAWTGKEIAKVWISD